MEESQVGLLQHECLPIIEPTRLYDNNIFHNKLRDH